MAELCGKQNEKIHIADEWLQHERDFLKQRPLTTGTVDEVRAAYANISGMLAGLYPAADSYNVTDRREWTDAGQPVRVYVPKNLSPSDKLPVGVFAHGGGHVIGGAWMSSFEDRMCRYIVENANVILVQVDFRLAPEFPVPTQVDDCLSAYKWAYTNASRLQGDTSRYFSIGSSLGGGVAFAVALKLADENKADWCKGIVSLCPALVHPWNVPEDLRSRFTAYEETWNDVPMQDGESMLVFYGHMGANKQTANPYVFPVLHPAVKNLPPVYQAVCGCDPVRDDATIMKVLLDKHGIENRADVWPGLPHYFWIFPQLPSSEPFHRSVAEGTKWVVKMMDKAKDAGKSNGH